LKVFEDSEILIHVVDDTVWDGAWVERILERECIYLLLHSLLLWTHGSKTEWLHWDIVTRLRGRP
jgi:hypothetical protein